MPAVLVAGMIIGGCTSQEPPTRATLPTVSTSSTNPPETGPFRLLYDLPQDSVMTWNADVVVGHELTVAAGSTFADGLAAAGIVDSTTEVRLDGVAETAALTGELVDVFTPTSGSIVGTIGGEGLDRDFSAEEIAALGNRRAGPPFRIDDLGQLRGGDSGAPGAVGVEISGIAPLLAVGPPLTEAVVDVGDRWELDVEGPLGSVLPLEVMVTGRKGGRFLLEVAGAAEPNLTEAIASVAGRPLLPGTADVTILDRLLTVASGTVRLDSIEVTGTMSFDPNLGLVTESRAVATVKLSYQLSDPRGGATAEVGERVDLESTRFYAQTTAGGLDAVLARLNLDPTTLAFLPLARIAGLGIANLEAGEELMAPLSAIRSDIFAAIVPAQVGTDAPVPVISFLLDGEVRGDPDVAVGVAEALNEAAPTLDEVSGRPVHRIEQGDEQWTFWSTPTHLFLTVGDAAVTDSIVASLMETPPPYRWQGGDCLDLPLPDTGVPFAPYGELHLSHCEATHSHEVIHVEELAEGPYPGEEAMVERADLRCGERFDVVIGGLDRGTTIEMITYLSNRPEWELGARYLGCMVYLGGAEGVVQQRGRLGGGGPDHPSDLKAGDCARGDVYVNCDDLHSVEIIGSVAFSQGPEASFPGITLVTTFTNNACAELLATYGVTAGELSIVAVGRPVTPYEWSTGIREFLCEAVAVEADGAAASVTGSFRSAWSTTP